jgi:small GTP-binding protein
MPLYPPFSRCFREKGSLTPEFVSGAFQKVGNPMKVVLVGDAQVGKTSMLNRLTSGTFREATAATVGAAFQTHVLTTPRGAVTMQIWDTAGQEKYRALAPMYYRSANVAVLCFDLTSRETFDGAGSWADELSDKASGDLQIILVGNKADLVEDRVVTKDEASDLAFRHGIVQFFECSAKTGTGIVEVFSKAAELFGPHEAAPSAPDRSPQLTEGSSGKKGCC